MKVFWENDDATQGPCVAVVDMEDGKTQPQRFSGKTEKEVADKLLQAQGHATQAITNLKKTAVQLKPRPLTADERFTGAQEISDPAKGPEAVRRIVEAAVGAPLEQVSEMLQQGQLERMAARTHSEGRAFVESTPDYQECAQNSQRVAQQMCLNGWNPEATAPTRAEFSKAWEDLKDAGLAILKTDSATQPDELQNRELRPTVTTRPRMASTSTGLRSGDSTATPGARTTSSNTLTVAAIEAMPQEEYERRLKGEPGFSQKVDAAYAAASKR